MFVYKYTRTYIVGHSSDNALGRATGFSIEGSIRPAVAYESEAVSYLPSDGTASALPATIDSNATAPRYTGKHIDTSDSSPCPVTRLTRLTDRPLESSSYLYNRYLNSGSSSSSSSSSNCNGKSNCNGNRNCNISIGKEGVISLNSRYRSAAWFPISVYDLVIIDDLCDLCDLCESNDETETEDSESRAKSPSQSHSQSQSQSQEVHGYAVSEGIFVRGNRPQMFISIESACKYDPGLRGSAMYIDTLAKEGGVCGLLPVWMREESVVDSIDDGTCEKRDGGDKACSSTVYVTWYRPDGMNAQGNNHRSTDIVFFFLLFFLSLFLSFFLSFFLSLYLLFIVHCFFSIMCKSYIIYHIYMYAIIYLL